MSDTPGAIDGADLDLRLVRHFTIVAEHGHVGRAAESLHLAQPALSRQIQRLEREVGTPLFERHRHGARLTDAGAAFLPLAQELLRVSRAAATAARAAARPSRIVVGHVGATLITPAVRALRVERPDADVQTLHLDWNEPQLALVEHRVDVMVARMPFPTDGLRVHHLYDEPRVLLVSRDHRLADAASVCLADIAEDPMPRLPDPDPEWAAFWRVDPRPDGRPAPLGPLVDTPADRLELVAGGAAVALATGTVRHGFLRPDLRAVPVEDIDPVSVVAAVRADEQRPLVTRFTRLAAALLSAPSSERLT